MMKWVYMFDEVEWAEQTSGGDWDKVRALLGGKGANLGDMTRAGVPVPPGFTVTTEACNAYLEAGEQFPEGLWEQELEAMRAIEGKTGKQFGNPGNPLLVSCRSGSKFSMPGMMDTVLNIGMTDEVAEGMVRLTGDERFVYDSYRRLIQMFGTVVMGLEDEPFEKILHAKARETGRKEQDFAAEHWKEIAAKFKELYRSLAGEDFPQDPHRQIRLSTEAVFGSWNGPRAVAYRNADNIPHNLGTGVNIQTMVFGNLGEGCATGVAMTRNATTGEPQMEGDYLYNAQGEDVVSGTRETLRVQQLEQDMPEVFEEFKQITNRLERHYKEMQDVEFTVERGKLWMLQTRDGKRTAQAAVRIACDLIDEGLIAPEQAVLRLRPDQVDFFLHPQFHADKKRAALEAGRLLTTALNVSPGAAVGQVAFDADLAEKWGKQEGKDVIMVRPETKPDDVHGMLAAKGILTSKGGRTSHAALVARQFGSPAVVGAKEVEIDLSARVMRVGDTLIREGDWISVDGTTGEVFQGTIETLVPDFDDPYLLRLLGYADGARRLQVWTNADYPDDAAKARNLGAQGIGLCRTEHMFFDSERLPHVQKLILNQENADTVKEALEALLPYQRNDFAGLFRVMNGLPVIIRLIDPPLHEFLPAAEEVREEIFGLKLRLSHCADAKEMDALLGEIAGKKALLVKIDALHESNPMLGLRGVRLGIQLPELTKMQVRAIFEAACAVSREGVSVYPEVMIPLASDANELKVQQTVLEEEARRVMEENDMTISYKFGTMIEVPRAALTAGKLAEQAQFFSFGTNDLTQTTYAISRDDAEKGFLIDYIQKNILPANPFATIDQEGVGQLMKWAVEQGRQTRPDLEIGICGEHGGDPETVAFCHRIGLDYVSCSPLRVPIARLAAGQQALRERGFTAK